MALGKIGVLVNFIEWKFCKLLSFFCFSFSRDVKENIIGKDILLIRKNKWKVADIQSERSRHIWKTFYVSYFRMSFFNFLCQKTARSSTFPLKTLALIFEIWNVLWKINSLSLTTKAVTYSCNCPFQRLIWKRRKKGIWIKFVILFHYNNKSVFGDSICQLSWFWLWVFDTIHWEYMYWIHSSSQNRYVFL